MTTDDIEPLLMQRIIGVGYVNGVLLLCTERHQEWYFRIEDGVLEVENNSWSPSTSLQ